MYLYINIHLYSKHQLAVLYLDPFKPSLKIARMPNPLWNILTCLWQQLGSSRTRNGTGILCAKCKTKYGEQVRWQCSRKSHCPFVKDVQIPLGFRSRMHERVCVWLRVISFWHYIQIILITTMMRNEGSPFSKSPPRQYPVYVWLLAGRTTCAPQRLSQTSVCMYVWLYTQRKCH